MEDATASLEAQAATAFCAGIIAAVFAVATDIKPFLVLFFRDGLAAVKYEVLECIGSEIRLGEHADGRCGFWLGAIPFAASQFQLWVAPSKLPVAAMAMQVAVFPGLVVVEFNDLMSVRNAQENTLTVVGKIQLLGEENAPSGILMSRSLQSIGAVTMARYCLKSSQVVAENIAPGSVGSTVGVRKTSKKIDPLGELDI